MVVESRFELLRPVGLVCRDVPDCSHASSMTTFRILSQFGSWFRLKERNTRTDATQWSVGTLYRILKLLNLFDSNSTSSILRIRRGRQCHIWQDFGARLRSVPESTFLLLLYRLLICLWLSLIVCTVFGQNTLYLVPSHFGARLSGIAHLAWKEACTAS